MPGLLRELPDPLRRLAPGRRIPAGSGPAFFFLHFSAGSAGRPGLEPARERRDARAFSLRNPRRRDPRRPLRPGHPGKAGRGGRRPRQNGRARGARPRGLCPAFRPGPALHARPFLGDCRGRRSCLGQGGDPASPGPAPAQGQVRLGPAHGRPLRPVLRGAAHRGGERGEPASALSAAALLREGLARRGQGRRVAAGAPARAAARLGLRARADGHAHGRDRKKGRHPGHLRAGLPQAPAPRVLRRQRRGAEGL